MPLYKTSNELRDETDFFYIKTFFKGFERVKTNDLIIKTTCGFITLKLPTREAKILTYLKTQQNILNQIASKADRLNIESLIILYYCLKYILEDEPFEIIMNCSQIHG